MLVVKDTCMAAIEYFTEPGDHLSILIILIVIAIVIEYLTELGDQLPPHYQSLLLLLRYESSTLILCKELSSPIFQSLSVRPSGMRDTLPDLHFVQYIKA